MSDYIRMEHITKRFPGVTASADVSIGFARGEIHALLGENGAGKSTLMNMLYGLLKPDEGQITIDGQPVRINGPQDAIAHGIGMVHQHFMLIPKFTVLENVILGGKLDREPLLDTRAARKRILDLSAKTGLKVDPDARIHDLSVGDQQRVEIIKVLYKGVDVLVMDEPTAVLTPQETDELFQVLRNWIKEGNTVIFITHKMREVLEFCDRVSVLRDGHFIETVPVSQIDEERLAHMMVGREVELRLQKAPPKTGETVLEVKDLTVQAESGVPAVSNVSFTVRAGETVGIAGVDGNGQLELIEAIMGLTPSASGEICLKGKEITHCTPKEILERGVSNIPFSRQTEGLVLNFSVRDNFILKERWHAPYAKHGLLQNKVIDQTVRRMIQEYSIKANGPETRAGNMSGGNQQKIVASREMERPHDLLVACHPTHGLDIGAIEFIHRRILREREEGKAVLLVSTEMDELLALSDRILVLFKGQIMGEAPATPEAVQQIGLMMLGKKVQAGAC
ncbi:ABC transporter ATP-binding protein [Pseudoflavonifractor gallinarum]|uniref:ABC transporter ATP-binding protein n=1 Tax=Eubacteriales TaxID=186802 RepID=UPI00336BD58A